MKYLVTLLLLFSLYSTRAQMKGDTTNPQREGKMQKDATEPSVSYLSGAMQGSYPDYDLWGAGRNRGSVFQCDLGVQVGLSTKDTTPAFRDIVFLMQQNKELSDRLGRAERKIDSLEARPYLFIDLNKQQPGVWLTNKEGEYMWYIAPINIK